MIRWNIKPKAELEVSDDGYYIEYKEAAAEIARLEKLLKSKRPICPYCKTEMEETEFKGYYDNFKFWNCNCGDDMPVKSVTRGGYC